MHIAGSGFSQTFSKHMKVPFTQVAVSCPPKGHTYLNKPTAFFKYARPFSGHKALKGNVAKQRNRITN